MTAKNLYAAPVVEQIKINLNKRCAALKLNGVTPSMCVVLVGNNPASQTYIRNKKKMCEEIGACFSLVQMDSDIPPQDFHDRIQELNSDERINGIIIQLPVSEQLKNLNIPNLIKPEKDIDGFHGLNTQNLFSGSTDLSLLMPCTPKGIVYLLKHYEIALKGKNVVIIGRSLIVGKPLFMLLTSLDATVTLAHSQTKNIRELTRAADIVVTAIGKPHFFDETYFDSAKDTIVIDVGMNVLNGKLTGDVNQASLKNVVKAISPVPGGVGPMTVISLIENLISATEKQHKGSI